MGKTQRTAKHKGADQLSPHYHRTRILRRRKNAVISSNRPMIMKSEAGVAVRGKWADIMVCAVAIRSALRFWFSFFAFLFSYAFICFGAVLART